MAIKNDAKQDESADRDYFGGLISHSDLEVVKIKFAASIQNCTFNLKFIYSAKNTL